MRANAVIMIALAAVFGIVAVVLANMWLADQRNAMARRKLEELREARELRDFWR